MTHRKVKKPLVCMIKRKIREASGEEGNEEFRQAYIEGVSDDLEACPPAWGDGGEEGIWQKFHHVFEAVMEEACKELGIPHRHLTCIIDPSLGGTTWAAILYNPWNHERSTLAWFESTKAWRLKWKTEDEMERELRKMVDSVVEKVRSHLARLPAEETAV